MISRKVLEIICASGKIVADAFVIDDHNRKSYYALFMAMYTTERKYIDDRRRSGIEKSVQQGNYKGRQRLKINELELNNTLQEYEAGKIKSKEAAETLQISLATFFRRYREYKKLNQ